MGTVEWPKQKTPRWMICMGPYARYAVHVTASFLGKMHGSFEMNQVSSQKTKKKKKKEMKQVWDSVLTVTWHWHIVVCLYGIRHVKFCRRTHLIANKASFNALLTKPILTRLNFLAFVAPSSRSLFTKINISPNVSPHFYFILFFYLIIWCFFFFGQ